VYFQTPKKEKQHFSLPEPEYSTAPKMKDDVADACPNSSPPKTNGNETVVQAAAIAAPCESNTNACEEGIDDVEEEEKEN